MMGRSLLIWTNQKAGFMVTCRSRYSNNDLVKTYNDLPHKCMEFKGNKNNLTKGDVSKVIKNKIIWIINL